MLGGCQRQQPSRDETKTRHYLPIKKLAARSRPIRKSTFGPDMIWMAHASDVRVKGLESFLHTTALGVHESRTGQDVLPWCVRNSYSWFGLPITH
jgi:hypothetical protein